MAYINGRYYNSGGDLTFALTSVAGSIKYVRIVVRVDLSAKTIITAVKESLSALPELTRDNSTYEISLATVAITAGATAITSGMIVDERSNDEVCGFFRFAGHEAYRVPSGTVSFHAGLTAPVGWLVRDGSLISRSAYPDLFAEIGTLYGEGDGSTTFALPNDLDLFIRGSNGEINPVGTKQDGTIFSIDIFGSRYVSGGDDAGTKGVSTGGNSHSGTNSTISVRPTNRAYLPIIKI